MKRTAFGWFANCASRATRNHFPSWAWDRNVERLLRERSRRPRAVGTSLKRPGRVLGEVGRQEHGTGGGPATARRRVGLQRRTYPVPSAGSKRGTYPVPSAGSKRGTYPVPSAGSKRSLRSDKLSAAPRLTSQKLDAQRCCCGRPANGTHSRQALLRQKVREPGEPGEPGAQQAGGFPGGRHSLWPRPGAGEAEVGRTASSSRSPGEQHAQQAGVSAAESTGWRGVRGHVEGVETALFRPRETTACGGAR